MMLPIIFRRRGRTSSYRTGYGTRYGRSRHHRAHWWYLLLVPLLALVALWTWYFLVPLNEEEVQESNTWVVTESRYVLTADGKDVLSFTESCGDTLLAGIGDSVTRRDTVPAQWTLKWQYVPFGGRREMLLPDDTAALCTMNSTELAALLKREAQHLAQEKAVAAEQRADVDYYLRTHTVIDNGFDIVARYSKELQSTTDSIAKAANLVEMALKGKAFAIRKERHHRVIGDSARNIMHRLPAKEKALEILLQRNARIKKAPLAAIDSTGTYTGERDSVAMPHGYGRFISQNGDFYEGEWQRGRRSGVGFSMIRGQRLRMGEWEEDKFLGERIAYTPERIYGIDISRYQHEKGRKRFKINWKDLRITSLGHKSKKNVKGVVDYPVRFIYIKATEGVSITNKYFAGDYASARKYGYRTGAYHFFSVRTPGRNQAIHFLKNSKYNKGDLPPVLDIEPSDAQIAQAGGINRLFANVREWIEGVEARLGVKPILYVSQRFVNKYLPQAPDLMKNYDVWIARYGEYKPNVNLVYWQLSPDGRVNGIQTEVDINVFNGFNF